jgi:hypothetical protein
MADSKPAKDDSLPHATNPEISSPLRPASSSKTKPLPLDVRIDVKGAYIINTEEAASTSEDESLGLPKDLVDLELEDPEDYEHDSNDIRLPQNRSVVSHMAVDVSLFQ